MTFVPTNFTVSGVVRNSIAAERRKNAKDFASFNNATITKTYQAIIPVKPGSDIAVLRWLTRESFDKKAAAESLTITGYTENTLLPADVKPEAANSIGNLSDYLWYKFTATASNA